MFIFHPYSSFQERSVLDLCKSDEMREVIEKAIKDAEDLRVSRVTFEIVR